ncbi:hypothetical protein LTS12_024325 [Elasticomyces elasticus]|nr:hypothetical protein LTS12_024325 [Elasticomyces elasticus]
MLKLCYFSFNLQLNVLHATSTQEQHYAVATEQPQAIKSHMAFPQSRWTDRHMSVFSDLMKDYIEVVAWTVIMTVIRRPGESSCFDPTALSQYIAYRYSVVKLSWAVVAAADKTLKTIDNGYETPDFILGPFAALSCIFTMWAMGDVNWADVYLAGAWALIGLLFQE